LEVPALQSSVIIATYNRAHVLDRSVSSVLKAIRPGDEVLVVDDGSTDQTEEVLAKYSRRIRYLKVKHSGVGAARNRGMREARNDLIAFLDSDDEWLPGQLELQRRILAARPELVFSFGNLVNEILAVRRDQRVLEIWRNGEPTWEEVMGAPGSYSALARLPDGTDDFPVYIGNLYRWELTEAYFSTINLVFRRDRCRVVPVFDEQLPVYEDWVFCGQLAHAGLGAYLDIATAVQHKDGGARLTDADFANRAAAVLDLLPRVWGADEEFLRDHRALYDSTLRTWRTRWVKGLITAGRIREARAAVRLMNVVDLPWRHRLALGLPEYLIRQVAKAARRHLGTRRPRAGQDMAASPMTRGADGGQ
jgi:glycosyltransferase involved in cell wall biosynthesis